MWTWKYEGTGELTKSSDGKRFILSLFLSLAIVVGGMAWTMRVGKDCNQLFHKLSHTVESVDGMKEFVARAGTSGGHVN
jgi:hypothetical protein